jgi:hypothetical protein
MKETVQLEVERYYFNGNDGPLKTCAFDLLQGECCRFLRTTKFGMSYNCTLCCGALLHRNRYGYLQPDQNCPIWEEAGKD